MRWKKPEKVMQVCDGTAWQSMSLGAGVAIAIGGFEREGYLTHVPGTCRYAWGVGNLAPSSPGQMCGHCTEGSATKVAHDFAVPTFSRYVDTYLCIR